MNTATMVDQMVNEWKNEGIPKSELIVRAAEATLGWPYVFGNRGQYCNPQNRRSRADSIRQSHPKEADAIVQRCQALRGAKDSCSGCSFYPGGTTRTYDCRGFTYWLALLVGITINGAGATSQWNDNNNWTQKGPISDMPMNAVCCVFQQNQKDHKTMEHTGMHVGDGKIIHCSGTVKTAKCTDKGWTHYALIRGLDGEAPEPSEKRPTIRFGSSGEYVRECQEDLIKLGYDVGKTGADGKFGANTEKGVKKFQTDHKLEPDGIVGPDSWKAIFDALKEPVKSVFYTAHVPHLTKAQADALLSFYEGGWKTAEEE